MADWLDNHLFAGAWPTAVVLAGLAVGVAALDPAARRQRETLPVVPARASDRLKPVLRGHGR
jgi:hypothetical protein